MINIAKLQYRFVCVTADGTQLDLTPIATNVGWEEGAKELAVRISMQLYNTQYDGKYISEQVQPKTPVFVYYDLGDGQGYKEAARGTVEKWGLSFSNGRTVLNIETYDEMNALRHNQDSEYFTEGTSTKDIITKVFKKWGIPCDYQGPDVALGKTIFKRKYLSDILQTTLKEAKKKGTGVFFARARAGTVEVVPRGSNTTVYHFDETDNAIEVADNFDASKIVTRVLIVGKTTKEGHEPVQATVDGKIEFGVRQIIYQTPKNKTLDEATATANEMLKEKGALQRKTTLQAPDLPFLRKGDRIRVKTGTVAGYFFVKSIRHNADDQQMTMEIDEDKEKNGALDTNTADEAAEDGDEA